MNRALLLRSMILSLTLLSSSAPLVPQNPVSYQDGVTAFRSGAYWKAVEKFREAEAAAPGKTDALLLAAKALVHLETFQSAEEALRGYLASHPQSDEALYLLGFVLHRQNRAAESLRAYTEAALAHPPAADDLKIVALDYVLLNDYPTAIHWLEKAVELDPRNQEAWYFLGRAYYTRSRIAEARGAFLAALKLDPRDAKAENNLGLIFESEAQPDAAMDAYRKAIAWQKNSPRQSEQPYLNLGSLLMEQLRADEAIPELEKAVEIAPGSAICRLRLGTAYLRLEKLEEARRELEKAAQLAPENPAAHFQLGKLYKEMKLPEKARAEFARTEELQSRAAASTKPQ